jgi:hypothetical protein
MPRDLLRGERRSDMAAVTAVSRASGSSTATLTTSLNHGINSGTPQSVIIAGTGDNTIDGTYTATYASATTFTITSGGTTAVSLSSLTSASAVIIKTIRPNSVTANGGFTTATGSTSASALYGAVTDNSDSTYIIKPSTSYGDCQIVFNFPDLSSSDYQSNQSIWYVQPRFRMVTNGSTNLSTLLVTLGDGFTGSYASPTLTLTGAAGTSNYTWGTQYCTFAGYPWSNRIYGQAYIDRADLYISDYTYTTSARAKIYEVWMDVYFTPRPYATSGTVTGNTATTRPLIGWTYSQADGLGQSAYQIKVFTATTSDPTNSAAVWDSGVTYSATNSASVGTDLRTNTDYYTYVRVGTRLNPSSTAPSVDAWSDWLALSSFQVQLNPPAPSVISGSWNGTNLTSDLTFTSYPNLLTLAQSTVDSTPFGWTAVSNCTLSLGATFLVGAGSMQINTTAAGASSLSAGGAGGKIPIAAGQDYKFHAWFRPNTTARTLTLTITWYQGATAIGTAATSTVTETASSWTLGWVTGTAPTGADGATIAIATPAATGAGESRFVDKIAFHPNDGGTYRANLITQPSFEGSTSAWSNSVSTMSGAVVSTPVYAGSSAWQTTVQAGVGAGDTGLVALGSSGYSFPSIGTYTVSAYFYIPTGSSLAGRTVTLALEGGTTANYSNGTSTAATLAAGQWVRASRVVTTTSSVGSASFVPRISTIGSGDAAKTITTDAWMLESGSSATSYFDGDFPACQWQTTSNSSYSVYGSPWTSGDIGSETLIVRRSIDMTSWTVISGSAGISIPDATGKVTLSDTDAPLGKTVYYQSCVTGRDSSANLLTSIYNPIAFSLATTSDSKWWIKDPYRVLASASSVQVQAHDLSVTVDEKVGVYRPFGRSTAVAVAGVIGGQDGNLTIYSTAAMWTTLKPLITAQQTIALQDPLGETKYIRVLTRNWEKIWTGGQQSYMVKLTYVETARP